MGLEPCWCVVCMGRLQENRNRRRHYKKNRVCSDSTKRMILHLRKETKNPSPALSDDTLLPTTTSPIQHNEHQIFVSPDNTHPDPHLVRGREPVNDLDQDYRVLDHGEEDECSEVTDNEALPEHDHHHVTDYHHGGDAFDDTAPR